jgi:recombinational DNA repair ATPase RecF
LVQIDSIMLRQLRMQNFRCFDDHTIIFEPNTVVVGKNNAGKSSVIEALRLVSAVVNRKGATFVPAPKWLEVSLDSDSVSPRGSHTLALT